MTEATNDKNNPDSMTTLRAQVAAQDAARNALFATIMVRKPTRRRKEEPELTWLVKRARNGTMEAAAPSDKSKSKKSRKAKP